MEMMDYDEGKADEVHQQVIHSLKRFSDNFEQMQEVIDKTNRGVIDQPTDRRSELSDVNDREVSESSKQEESSFKLKPRKLNFNQEPSQSQLIRDFTGGS